jgi:hypothetical protein
MRAIRCRTGCSDRGIESAGVGDGVAVRSDESATGELSGGALAPVRLTAELERELRAGAEGASADEWLRQGAFMRAREKQYGDRLATVGAVGHWG